MSILWDRTTTVIPDIPQAPPSSQLYSALNGVWFLSNGQQNANSLWMALGYIAGQIAYAIGYLVSRPTPTAIARARDLSEARERASNNAQADA